VNQLSNQIDNLQLADNNDDDSPMDSDGTRSAVATRPLSRC